MPFAITVILLLLAVITAIAHNTETNDENQGASSGVIGSSTETPEPLFFIYEKKRVAATRPQTYLSALAICRKLFPHIPQNSKIKFQTKDLDVCKGELADISPESFELLVPLVTSLVVVAVAPISGDGMPVVIGQTRPEAPIVLTMQPTGDLSIEDIGNLRIGKPVIYLSSPREIEATVRLSLVPQWSLSVIYPVVPSKPRSASSNEEVEWQVRVHPNGDLTELITGLDVAYLFWEAHTNPQLPISPPASPVLGQACLDNIENLNPVTAVLTNDNSVVLSVASITPYLDRALKALGLHTEARTSFITYWLPLFLKHKYVAFRFVPQTAYEKAAPLEITPKPDNITRVFMLFQGVKEEELIDWKCAQANSAKDAAFWADVAGIDLEKALDPSIFRVLEWGGMEVYTDSDRDLVIFQ